MRLRSFLSLPAMIRSIAPAKDLIGRVVRRLARPQYAASSRKSRTNARGLARGVQGRTKLLIRTTKGGAVMAYEPAHTHEPAPADPDRGSATGYAAIKYSATIIIVLAILAFLVWALTRFFG
jgi:hypothetical protein